jgi:DNA modification methylase
MFFSPLKNVIVEDNKFGFCYINECKDVYENVEVKKIASVYPNIDNLEDLFSELNFTIEDHWLISLSKK